MKKEVGGKRGDKGIMSGWEKNNYFQINGEKVTLKSLIKKEAGKLYSTRHSLGLHISVVVKWFAGLLGRGNFMFFGPFVI